MDNRDTFFEIIKKAEKNGYKGHLKMLPVMPMTPSSAELLAKNIFWQRRHEIMFSHEFAKAFWKPCSVCNGKGKIEDYSLDLPESFNCGYWKECPKCKNSLNNKWDFNLRNLAMCLEKDRIIYLKLCL